MKVVLATTFPRDPEQPRGGVEAVSVILARALAARSGLDVHVVTTDRDEASESRWHGVTVHRVAWRAPFLLLGATGGAARALAAYIEGLAPDVVHAHDTYGIMLRHLTRPRVLTIHGFIYADTRLSGRRLAPLRSAAWKRVETAAWAAYPHIISISPYVRERLSGIATGTIHDIDNPVADGCFDIVSDVGGPCIFCAASITPRKNIVGLVDAFAQLRARGVEATLRVAGPAPHAAYVARVRERIAALGLERDVTLLPSLQTADVWRELSLASVAALISLEENAPLTVQEAMAAGVPVVTSNRCGMPYMVTHGETGYLVDPHDPADVSHCLEALVTNPERRRTMGARARQVARERFLASGVAGRTVDVYAQAVQGIQKSEFRSQKSENGA